jgi:hypothetical protein
MPIGQILPEAAIVIEHFLLTHVFQSEACRLKDADA